MKKIYLQPTMTVGTMMPLGLIASSWGVNSKEFTDSPYGEGSNGSLTGGGSGQFGGAKERGFYSTYEDEW